MSEHLKKRQNISVETFRVGTTVDFDVYKKVGDGYKIIIQSGTYIDADAYKILSARDNQLNMKKSDLQKFLQYREAHMFDILNDDTIEEEVKSKLFYDSTSLVMHHVIEDPMAKENIDSAKAMIDTVLNKMVGERSIFYSLMKVAANDYYTYTHSVNVSTYSMGLGKALKLNMKDMKYLGQGSILHDIGKSKIDRSIINKPGRLTNDEFETIKGHTTLGYDLMKYHHNETNEAVLSCIRSHQEKHDGTGYPDGLLAKDITLEAQIVSIADIFDALTTKRSYKDAFSTFKALKIMKDEMLHHYDPEVFQTFIALMGRKIII